MTVTDELRRSIRVELAARDLTRVDLARRMRVSYHTLSGWILGLNTAPDDLSRRIERALQLSPGALSNSQETSQ